jgi:hypothetical protein
MSEINRQINIEIITHTEVIPKSSAECVVTFLEGTRNTTGEL